MQKSHSEIFVEKKAENYASNLKINQYNGSANSRN